jgi:hypothetical protein
MTHSDDIVSFQLHPSPTAELWNRACSANPENPFYTAAYADARRELGDQTVMIFGFGSEGACVCPGFLRSGRISSSLDIPSIPAAPSKIFLEGLRRFCKERGIYEVTLNTYASPALSIPELPVELERRSRTEYLFDLQIDASQWKIGRTHRQRARQAEKNGIQLLRTSSFDALEAHVGLMNSSMRRRKERGEDVSVDADLREASSLIRAGAAEIFQGVQNGVVLSSMLVLRSRTGGYDHSSGTHPDGMAIGASHFLVHSVARTLQADGCTAFNLGGASADEAGLKSFKVAFGTFTRESVMVRASLCAPARRMVTGAAQALARIATRAAALVRYR